MFWRAEEKSTMGCTAQLKSGITSADVSGCRTLCFGHTLLSSLLFEGLVVASAQSGLGWRQVFVPALKRTA